MSIVIKYQVLESMSLNTFTSMMTKLMLLNNERMEFSFERTVNQVFIIITAPEDLGMEIGFQMGIVLKGQIISHSLRDKFPEELLKVLDNENITTSP